MKREYLIIASDVLKTCKQNYILGGFDTIEEAMSELKRLGYTLDTQVVEQRKGNSFAKIVQFRYPD